MAEPRKMGVIKLDDPVRKLIHECSDHDGAVNAQLVGFSPLDKDGHVSYGVIITGENASILAEMVVGFLNTLQSRVEQKDVHESPPRLQ